MTDTRIAALTGRRVWDSRGRPTVEAEVRLGDGSVGRAIAPAGASRGSGEAIDRRDGGSAFGGYDVRNAVAAVNGEIAAALDGAEADDQAAIDEALVALDGTPNRSRLGGNALVATSLAVLHARSAAARLPLWRFLAGNAPVRLPLPEIQIFGGGAHAERRVDVQDFMVMCPAAGSFAEALDWTAEIYRAAGDLMRRSGRLQGVADEGGHWPAFSANDDALDTLMQAIEAAGLRAGSQVVISLDVAASELRHGDRYRLALGGHELETSEMIDMLGRWIDAYPIASIEDPVAEDDHAGFVAFTSRFGERCQVIGDDYLVTNAARVRRAAEERAATAVLLKPNQVGTVTETFRALQEAKRASFGTIVSARSGETEDVSISHLAVGWDAGQLKVGSFTRSERMAKWNECLRIESEFGDKAEFAGWSVLPAGARRP